MGRLGLLAPPRHAEPDRLLDLVAGVVGIGAVGRHVQIGDGLATGRVAHLRITPEVANEDDFVEHGDSPYQWGQVPFGPGGRLWLAVPTGARTIVLQGVPSVNRHTTLGRPWLRLSLPEMPRQVLSDRRNR